MDFAFTYVRYVQNVIHSLEHFLFPSLRFPCSVQCWSVCILSKAVIIAEHQGSPWLSQGHTSESCETWAAAWTGLGRIHETPFRAEIAKRGVKKFSIAHHDWVWAVSFPHIILTFTFTTLTCWCVLCPEPGWVCGLVCAHHTWLTNAETKAWYRSFNILDLVRECSSHEKKWIDVFLWEREQSTVVSLGSAKSQI